jgi:pimeloyl-ACP methyl ester carboxylesterase
MVNVAKVFGDYFAVVRTWQRRSLINRRVKIAVLDSYTLRLNLFYRGAFSVSSRAKCISRVIATVDGLTRRCEARTRKRRQGPVKSYPKWQQWLRDHQPPLLVLWGRYDTSFTVAGGEAYRRDDPRTEVHILLDAGHFALDSKPKEIIRLTEAFLDK